MARLRAVARPEFLATVFVILLLQEPFIVKGLLPACGPVDHILGPCYEHVATTSTNPMNMPRDSECCHIIQKRFRFPGCFCVSLVEDIGRDIDERSAVAALSLWQACGRSFPRGFNCTGFSSSRVKTP